MLESATADLPEDIESLRALLISRTSELSNLRMMLRHRDAQIEKLLLQLARLKRMQFGAKSEKLDREIEQLELLIEELQTPSAVPPRASTADAATEKAVPARRPLPEHLPRESIVHAPAAACPSCGGALRAIGEDVSEMLDYVPAHWKVIRHVRPKCACDACQHIVQAQAPSRPIPRGIAAPGLLAHVLVAKYCDSLPLHRQAEMYARDGVEIERSTLADWVGGSAALLAPLVERLGVHVMSATSCVIRGMSVQHSAACRSSIPRHVGPAFRGMSVQRVRRDNPATLDPFSRLGGGRGGAVEVIRAQDSRGASSTV